jgi:hypothetical protein
MAAFGVTAEAFISVRAACFAANQRNHGASAFQAPLEANGPVYIFLHLVMNRVQTNVYGPVLKKMDPILRKSG